ncbi:hypothetical protein B0H14DRAFT_1610961 [Mycena olivaceomarginata]|nr:hypothetical protein B0H14DRAFT_1610961 [Mycena olivaceomarginata]
MASSPATPASRQLLKARRAASAASVSGSAVPAEPPDALPCRCTSDYGAARLRCTTRASRRSPNPNPMTPPFADPAVPSILAIPMPPATVPTLLEAHNPPALPSSDRAASLSQRYRCLRLQYSGSLLKPRIRRHPSSYRSRRSRSASTSQHRCTARVQILSADDPPPPPPPPALPPHLPSHHQHYQQAHQQSPPPCSN